MTLSTFNDTSVSSDATFRTWASQWDTAIKAVGLVATADTGQMNFGTVVRPAINTKAGYVIYAFNDANQGSYPCLIRVDYGCGSATSQGSLWLTVCTTTDGAGTPGAIKTATIQIQQPSASAYASAVSGSTSRLTLALSYTGNTSTAAGFFSVERLQTSAGADATTGLVFTWVKNLLATNTYTLNGQQVLYFTGTQPAANNSATSYLPSVFANTSNTSTTWTNYGNNTYVGLIYPVGSTVHYPIQSFAINYPGDVAPTAIITMPLYGSTRSWYSMPNAITNQLAQGAAAQMSLLVRWD